MTIVVVHTELRTELLPPEGVFYKHSVALAIGVVDGMMHAVIPRCMHQEWQQQTVRFRDLGWFGVCHIRVEGEMLFREGEPGDALYLVMEGKLAVIKGRGTNREIILGHMGKGEFLGDMALIDHQPRSATIRADSDSLLLVLGAEDFNKIMKDFPLIPLTISKILSQRIQALQARLQDLGDKNNKAD